MSTAPRLAPMIAPQAIEDAWHAGSSLLAQWAWNTLVNRTDVYGAYLPLAARKKQTATTQKTKHLDPKTLRKHFLGECKGDVIGLHSSVRDSAMGEGEVSACWSRWGAIDLDRHNESTDPAKTQAAALALYQKAKGLGFRPILEDSNGNGGYHLWVVFNNQVPTGNVYLFLKWMLAECRVDGLKLDEAPETFPKQATLSSGKGAGNWLRIPGPHHARPFWSRIWNGSTWLDGDGAVKAILATTGDDPTLIPAEALAPSRANRPAKGKRVFAAGDLDWDATLARDALGHLSGQVEPYTDWLRVGMALTPLGGVGLSLWDEWSRGGSTYQEGVCERKWQTFQPSGLGLGTLFSLAEQSGWVRPRREPIEAKAAKVTVGPGPKIVEAEVSDPVNDLRAHESDDDPHRLARIYLDAHGYHEKGRLLHYHRGEFHSWDGGCYLAVDDSEIRAQLTLSNKHEFDRINLIEQQTAVAEGKKKPTAKKVTTSQINSVEQALASYTILPGSIVQPAWLDGDTRWPASEMLPTKNRLIHLPSFVAGRSEGIPPTPQFFCPYVLGYDFDPKASAPAHWLDFLAQLWPDDPESIAALQEWFGLHLLPDMSFQKIMMLIGPRRSGKGTILRILEQLIGPQNVANPTLSKMGQHFGLESLIGKLAAILGDVRLSGKADVAEVVGNLLTITGQDATTIPRKHRPDWKGSLAVRFTLASNVLPKLTESSEALAGRMLILELTRSFYGHEDLHLTDRLKTEMPGILLWAIEGWRRLRERGEFVQPKSASALVTEMEELTSPIGKFVKECTVNAPDHRVNIQAVFGAWLRWCERENHEFPGNKSTFGTLIRSVLPGLETKPFARHGDTGREFVGLALRDN